METLTKQQALERITTILDNSIDGDWNFNGEDEVYSESFDKHYALSEITKVINEIYDHAK